MKVVKSCPAVRFVANLPVCDAVPDMTPALFILAIPGKRRSPMQPSELSQRLFQIIRLDVNMVMIREETPRANLTWFQRIEQCLCKVIHTFWSVSDDGCMLIARSCEVELTCAAQRVRRCVPGAAAELAQLQDMPALLQGHSPPCIHAHKPASQFAGRQGSAFVVRASARFRNGLKPELQTQTA